ncbi:hypothetical protein CU048_14335 [Beijerinckiaceae bacterium]|nr:hypothetical protein CU048_14335 [Beijerinckiaceae bacterium]
MGFNAELAIDGFILSGYPHLEEAYLFACAIGGRRPDIDHGSGRKPFRPAAARLQADCARLHRVPPHS